MTNYLIENDFLNEINDSRIPINVFLMLTSKCNFYCKHCFVSPEKNSKNELTKEEWFYIIDILKREGTVYLVFSGGEPLLNKDFIDIYKYAYSLNFRIILFTNASMLKESHIELFEQMPPYRIEISLYGMSDETYKEFCGIEIKHENILNNIKILVKKNINVKIKVVANKYNFKELEKMRDFCQDINKKLNVYRSISCNILNDFTNTQVRLSEDDILQTYEINDDFCRIFVGYRRRKLDWTKGYLNCGAGISSCHIDYSGNLYLCNRCYFPKFSINDGFDIAWQKVFEQRRENIEIPNVCSNCDKKYYCGKCTPHLNSLNDYKEECLDINRIIKKLKIPKEKCVQYEITTNYSCRKIGKYYLLYSLYDKKGLILNEIAKNIYEYLTKGYTLYETAEKIHNQMEEISFDKILRDVKSAAIKFEEKDVLKKVFEIKIID